MCSERFLHQRAGPKQHRHNYYTGCSRVASPYLTDASHWLYNNYDMRPRPPCALPSALLYLHCHLPIALCHLHRHSPPARSVISQLPLARRLLGYCPQGDALPDLLTGREVLQLYARLRGETDQPPARAASRCRRRQGSASRRVSY